MQLTVKTLKGEKFVVNAEPTNTVAEVKTIIEAAKAELPACNMKLIHSGKVLKDTDSIESCNIKPNAFLVVMIAKVKNPAAVVPTPTPPPTTAPAPIASESASASTTTDTSSTSAAAAPTPSSSTSESAPAPAANDFPQEVITNLTSMGFREAEVRACLQASQGNPDVAVEFLMNGIPPGVQALQQGGGSSTSGGTSPTSGGEPLSVLRSHPQINQLRRLVQENPSTLQAVLTQIGQQQPELLQEINSNQELFLQIMNEPVEEDSTTSAPVPSSPLASNMAMGGGDNPGAGMLEGMNNPAQMSQMLQNMDPQQIQSLAGMMGLTPEQLTMTAQMITRMPPEEFQNYMNTAMSGMMGGAGPGAGAGAGGAGGGRGGPGGPQVLELSQEEMAAVDRLADMGFDRTDAAQAYIACDKNEALAANLLMDGGFGFGGDASGGDGGSGGAGGGSNDNDGDDMYN
eukprot:CAMPEP_0198249222 /NCGR_PEP_ID=MMETSP1447-20131203/793_1 /TAXON_ID=420782 /ORGANISM="Chaetoceros dichaeta, Strain CCMP1751" /LENGTH=457 /DNA_ID=CAMNT_0043933795 /DNA_START=85 /DNA_END=1461 /DNA_ORIENTATION=-